MRSTVVVLLPFVLVAMMVASTYAGVPVAPPSPPAPAALVWADPTVSTSGVALSRDGQYVAVVTGSQLRFYGRGSSTPLWTNTTQSLYIGVAISADGNYVAVGGSGFVAFWANALSRSGSGNPATWITVNLGGPIQRRCIVISDNGNDVAACGTGPNVFYWAGAAGRTGSGQLTTWDYGFGGQVEAMAISPDGNYVAAVTENGYVAYWKNARSLTERSESTWPGQVPTWSGQEIGETLVDVAISSDGDYVAAAGNGGTATVYYWAGALTRSTQAESHTWAGDAGVPFGSIDMSSSGDSVIAGAVDGVYFWSGARMLTGTPTETWKYPTTNPVRDVAIDGAGDYMAACTVVSFDTVYFFDSTGSAKWIYEVGADKLSISSDGGTLAVGTPAVGTSYLISTGFSTHISPTGPVGGFMQPVNKLTVIAPYLALLGVIGAVTVIVWKKPRE
jgi:WD40 repeat protein